MMARKSKRRKEKYKMGLIAGLLAGACFLSYYFHAFLETCVLVSHVFYIPIILAAVWWGRKSLVVAAFSSVFVILSHIFFMPDVSGIDDYFRGLMFVVIAFVVGELSERIGREKEELRAVYKQLRADERHLRAANQQLDASNQQLGAANKQLAVDEAELRDVNHALGERVKELDCLYGLSQVAEREDMTLEGIFQGLAELIPASWQYPDITGARVTFEGRRFKTDNFRETAWMQSAEIKVGGRKAGVIEVCYRRKKPVIDEGPFLSEERNLINVLAERLGHIAARKRAEEELQAPYEQLQASEQQLRAANQQLDASNQQLKAANDQLQASEQQVRAANQQLGANEQQLKAANQQLRAEVAERKKAEKKIKASLREKEVLLKEIHHRVKNNMQVISSILNLQSKHIEDEQALKMFKNGQSRIRSMAMVHEKLYESKDLAGIDFAEYIQSTISYLFSLHGVGDAVRLDIDIKDVLLGIDTAIPCGLIINELVSNSIKHAFGRGREGEILIKLYSDKAGRNILIVKDDGVGFPKGLDFRKTESLGMQLVIMLVEQLGGAIELDRSKGTAFKITFERAGSSL